MSYTLPKPSGYLFSRPGISKIDVWPHGGDWEKLYTEENLQAAHAAGRASRDAEVEALKLEAQFLQRAVTRRDERLSLLEESIDKLRLEAEGVEALRADAERYRALRDVENQLHEDDISVSDSSFTAYFGEELDAAIDALVARNTAARAAQEK